MQALRSLFSCTALVFLVSGHLSAQDPLWDDTSRPGWPAVFKEVGIPSSADGKTQMAYFYPTKSDIPKPLVVSLHTWSNNYQQIDPLIGQILENDYNYIRPDFRGPNNTSEACGGPLVASDIDDAISYAIEHGHVDPDQVHVIGVSGGGHATLIAYMQSAHQIRSFAAWVPITDLARWHEESIGRNNRYAAHIALATTGHDDRVDLQEARRRSPLYMNTPTDLRHQSKLYLYAGIHDGYTGSVPITHSLHMYNKVVSDFDPSAAEHLIPAQIIQRLVVSRYHPTKEKQEIAGSTVHYRRQFADKVQLTIFEGGHEMLTDHALRHVPGMTIMAIGDSNGANENGWVNQVQNLRFNDTFINTSVSGNTIGFDNNGQASRNSLKAIHGHLTRHDPGKNRIDKILIMLGTNDCKHEYHSRLAEVPGFYRELIQAIQAYYLPSSLPEIVLISPPPYGDDPVLQEKYHGAAERVKFLNEEFKKVANAFDLKYIDIQSAIWPVFDKISGDGVHFNEEGYRLLGFLINQAL